MRHVRAALLMVFATAFLVTIGAATSFGADHAVVTAKTIDTTTGECTKDANQDPVLVNGGGPCGAAVYGSDGFTGHIYGSGSGPIEDYLCVHTPSDAQFKSYGGTYTLTIYDASHTVIGTTTEAVTAGQACSSSNNAVTSGSVVVDFDANGGVVSYAVSIDGLSDPVAAFAANNSILNRVVAEGDGKANSPSVAPPAPVAEIPEAPLPALLVVSAGVVGVAFIARRRPRVG